MTEAPENNDPPTPEMIALAAQLDGVNQLSFSLVNVIETLTIKSLGVNLRHRWPEAAFLDLADGDQSETQVIFWGLLGADGHELEIDQSEVDEEVADLVMNLISYRLDDHALINQHGVRNNPRWRIDLARAAELPVPEVTP